MANREVFTIHEAASLWCGLNPLLPAAKFLENQAKNDYKALEEPIDSPFYNDEACAEKLIIYSEIVESIALTLGSSSQVTRKELRQIAEKLNERPQFLFSDKFMIPELAGNIDDGTKNRLSIAIKAAEKFWSGITAESWQYSDTRKGRDKTTITEWLVAQGLNTTQAAYIDKYIRPEFAAKGGQAKQAL